MKQNIFNKRLAFSIFICCLLITSHVSIAQKFVIPVFPDTQNEVRDKIAMFYSQLNWIVQQKDSLNIPIVLHVGDIVEDYHDWENVSKGFKVLDSAGVVYALTLGNHDSDGPAKDYLRKTTKFNSFFPVSRFTVQKGRYEEGKSDNAWYTFKAGGLNWLVLALEKGTRQSAVDWANTVVANHPDHNVIIITHYHLTPNGEIGENEGHGDGLSPEEIYNQLTKKHANILLVLSGHIPFTSWRNDKGENGNRIYQILQDYQREDSGGGYLRLLEIDPDKNTISAKMYSPYYNKYKQDASLIYFSHVKFIRPE